MNRDRHRLLAFRLAVHLACWLPLAWLLRAALAGELTANPIQAAEQRTGQFAITLLLSSLACTPLNTLFGWHALLKVRRALGLYTFMYALVHLFILVGVDYGFDFGLLWADLASKPYILAGAATLLLLIPLVVTSFRWFMRRMGRGWARLHRLVYAAGALAVVHYAWAVKGDVTALRGDILWPVVCGVVLALLLALRIPAVRRSASRLRSRARAFAARARRRAHAAPRRALHLPVDD